MTRQMKKTLLISFALLNGMALVAQDAFDALRLSQFNPVNTARIRSIGGANVSLGGDLSSAYINPAGLAQYKTNEVVLTPGFFMNRANMKYNDSSFKKGRAALNNGASGLIVSWSNRWRSSNIKNTTISLTLNQTANFNSNFNYRGRNTLSSYSEKWVEELVANQVDNFNNALNFFPNGASLAVENYLVDTILSNGSIIGYRTNAETLRMPLDQEFVYETRGGVQEATFGAAWNFREKILYGFSIGMPFVDFRRNMVVTERDGTGNSNNDFSNFRLTETFSTKGAGLNARLGVIFKPVEHFRIGLTFHTPTIYSLTDRTNATLTTDVENYARRISGDNTKGSQFSLSTGDITGGEDYTFSYQLTTPWRAAASLSYVFREIKDVTKQKAFLTADVELVNYKSMSYSSNSESFNSSGNSSYFTGVNNDIDALYRMALNARIGGELKFKTMMVRAGFNYAGSPYKKGVLPADAKAWSLTPSLGVGYRDKGMFADLTYAHTLGRDVHFAYILSGNNYPYARNHFNAGQLVATIGFKF